MRSMPTAIPLRARRASSESGQTVVLAALMLTALVGFTAIAIDIGRFVSERRFLQNAADAAALAAATTLAQGRSTAEAETAARDVLAINFASDPTGGAPALPPALPVYAPGHEGQPDHLVHGVLVQNGDVRVAVRKSVLYTFGRVVGVTEQEVSARSRAGHSGGLMPIAVREFVQAPGPESGATAPCTPDESRFMAFFATQDTACAGSDQDASLRTDPSAGSAFDAANPANDPTHHGPIVAILGQRATPSNASDFRGFVALDIRNFSTTTSQVFFNGVTSGTSADALKNKQAAWITRGGYPGPAFTSITSPPDPNDQVAILSGNSAGIAVQELAGRYAPGDEILVGVYPGHVMAIPDFALSAPSTVRVPATGTVADAGSLRVSRNQAFNGSVDLTTLPDLLDPDNPMVLGTLTGADPIVYSPDPVTPALGNGTRVDLRTVTTSGATPGIYALWIRGQAGSPYLTAKLEPFALNVGGVTRDFTLTADATGKVAQTAGTPVSFTLQLRNADRNLDFGGPVQLSLDTPLPAGTGLTSFTSSSVTPSRNGGTTTLTIHTGGLAPGHHRFVVRATGMNGDSPARKVTHLLPVTVNVAPTSNPGNDEYVDLTGFAVMRVVSVDSNTVNAYAITPVIKDLSDPRLRRGQTARLAPW